MATTRATLKQYFKKYATPTEAQFHELIDAFVHKDEDSLTQSKIDGLVQALNEKVTTNEVNTLVENKVTEIVSDPQFSAAPTAHSHVAADVEGLSAFITRVTNFLDSADVSDTTINRWKEIETFLTGITDQETLTGLLLQLKNEITALIPAPAPTNYLKQISDLDAYTEAQEGEIVQYVGSTTENYRRGFCYERALTTETTNTNVSVMTIIGDYGTSDDVENKDTIIAELTGQKYYQARVITRRCYGTGILLKEEGEPEVGDLVWFYPSGVTAPITEITETRIKMNFGLSCSLSSKFDMTLYELNSGAISTNYISNSQILPRTEYAGIFLPYKNTGVQVQVSFAEENIDIQNKVPTWQPIVTSPVVS